MTRPAEPAGSDTGAADPAASAVLGIECDLDGASAVLTFTGELDIATLADAEQAVCAAEATRPGTLLIDLSALDFVDSSGVRLVLQALARARDDGRRLAVVLGNGRSRRLFDVLGLIDRLDVVDGRDAL